MFKKKLYSINLLLIFGSVSCFCFIFFYVKQPNWAANSIPSSITGKTHLQSNSSDSPTTTKLLLFGLVGSEKAMHHRKDYIESWWRPNEFRGYLYLDKTPQGNLLPWSSASPPYRVSDDLTKFIKETHAYAPIMVRMVHAIMEIVRDERKGFRWLIMGDDDSIFFVDNMVDVLAKYDHTKYYYLGGPSECIITNYGFSFNMGFGGAGLICSYPLAKALANDMEGCLRHYAHLHSADHITMVCIADIGVNLSPQKGLHQVDLRGNIAGFLSSHPKNLLMSLHHFDVVNPIFPSMNRFESSRHLMKAANADQSRLLQQTICYLRRHRWSISISWGYSVHIYEKIIPRSWLQNPIETFRRWGGSKMDPPRYFLFNTRAPSKESCEAPHIFFFDSVKKISKNSTLTSYIRSSPRKLPPCVLSADIVSHVDVYSPATKRIEIDRCECCDVTYADRTKRATVRFRECRPEEIIR